MTRLTFGDSHVYGHSIRLMFVMEKEFKEVWGGGVGVFYRNRNFTDILSGSV